MTWAYFSALIPSMFMHWIVTVALCTVVWWYAKESSGTAKLKWTFAFALGTAISFFFSLNTITQISQGSRIAQKQQELSTQAQAQAAMAAPGNNPNLQPGSEDEMKVRQEFLKIVEQLVNNPDKVTPDVRTQVIASFQGVFGNQQLSQLYKQNVVNFFLCGRSYMQDALTSLQQKKEVKSKDLTTCAGLAGEFFGRPKLIPDEFAKPYVEIISTAGKTRKIASAEFPNGVEDLKKALEKQNVAIQVIGFLFQ